MQAPPVFPCDPELAQRLGDATLVVPDEGTLCEWVARVLATGRSPAPLRAELLRVRWKPASSLTTLHALALADGTRTLVATKRFLDGKDRLLERRGLAERHAQPSAPEGLRPWGFVPEARTALWTAAADRRLSGLARLFDPRKLARSLEASGFAPERALRRSTARHELLRYKPERRAVVRVSFERRDRPGERVSAIARVHPPRRAALMLARRQAFEAESGDPPDWMPRLVAHERRLGWVFEQDLDVCPAERSSFAHAAQAGRLLARLHRAAGHAAHPPPRASEHAAGVAEEAALIARLAPELARSLADRLATALAREPGREQARWTHGDAHPDQLARAGDGSWFLLDLDELAVRDPHTDLASWAADVDRAGEDPREALAPLLESYQAHGGAPLEARRLAELRSVELVRRAAGALRRLEAGAEASARELVALALGQGRSPEAPR